VSESGGKPNAFTSAWAKLKSSLFEIDSLDSVEVLIALEEVFEVEITDAEAEGMTTPGHVMDWLVPRVCDKQPNEKARRILNEQCVSAWDRARVSAVVRFSGLSVFVSALASPAEATSSAPVRSRMSFAFFTQSELSQ
jgi:acyl carrier protein